MALEALINNMLETMYAAPGIGLAATQVDVHKRIIVMDVSDNRDDPRVFINPTISIIDAQLGEYEEGCLSVPGFFETVNRPQKIQVTALDTRRRRIHRSARWAFLLFVCSMKSIISTASCLSTTFHR